ncbi:hypothetical protein KC8_17560 [Sphingomonas sp. KC8]|nr:hypothetical protein KC8_17560 [Sphingomonas sp. KC8]
MADMVLIDEAIENATYAALIAGMPTGVADVYQHVPARTAPSYVVIGKIDTENQGGKDGIDVLGQVEIACFFEGPARAGLWAIMRAVFNALHDQPLSADGVVFGGCRWLNNQSDPDNNPETDNVRYLGLMNFEIWAEPAE